MSTVASARISDNILAASDQSVCSALALIHDLSLVNVIAGKAVDVSDRVRNKFNKGTWASESSHFKEKLDATSRQFEARSPGERLLLAVGELQKLMGVRPRDLRTPLDLSDAADDIAMEAVKVLRQDKNAGFTGNDLRALIDFQLTKVFKGMKLRIEDLSAEDQEDLVTRVRAFVQSLPADQQKFIMEKLGATELSDTVVRQAIATGTIWAAFTAAVEIFGFAFYATAAHLLAILSLHLLPFGFYVGLSSTIFVLSQPWMLFIYAGIGLLYYGHKNKQMRQGMAPFMVASLCLSGMEGKTSDPGRQQQVTGEALALWRDALTTRDQARGAAADAKSVSDKVQAELLEVRGQLRAASSRKRDLCTKRDAESNAFGEAVLAAVPVIASGGWGTSLAGAAGQVQSVERALEEARRKRDAASGFLERIKVNGEYLIVAAKLNLDLRATKLALVGATREPVAQLAEEAKQGRAISDRAPGLSVPDYPSSAVELLRSWLAKLVEIAKVEGEIRRLTALESETSARVDAANAALAKAKSAKTSAEQRYHGLGTV